MRIYNENVRLHTHFTEVTSLDGFCSNATALSGPFRKEFLVQVNMQDGIFADMGTGGAINLNIDWGTFDKTLIMQQVAQFYCDYDRGAGIDLYWVNRPFKTLTTQQPIMGRPNGYRYTGDMVYTPKPGTQVLGDLNGSTWISSDGEYKNFLGQGNSELYYSVFPPTRGIYHQMLEENHCYSELSGFVLLLLLSRDAVVMQLNNVPNEVRPQGPNAFAVLADLNAPYNSNRQGAILCLAAIAEERPFNTNITGLAHYTSPEFLDVIGYCIAHELFHLLGGLDLVSLNGISGVFLPLPQITVSPAELLQINLKNRKGVTQ